MVKLQKKEKSFYEGKEIKQVCQGCPEGIVEMEIVATDRIDQVFKIGFCPKCIQNLKAQFETIQ